MFELDTTVPESLLPKSGEYTMNITKAEVTASKAGNLMIKLEMVIPTDDPNMIEQRFSNTVKVFDFIVFPMDASGNKKDVHDMCKIKANNFMKAAELVGKDNTAIPSLVGKSISASLKQTSDSYGDKMVVNKYKEGSLKDVASVPF